MRVEVEGKKWGVGVVVFEEEGAEEYSDGSRLEGVTAGDEERGYILGGVRHGHGCGDDRSGPSMGKW